jgi:hypothetical protein
MDKRGFLASFASLGWQKARKWPVFQGFRDDARRRALRHPCVMVRHGGRRCVRRGNGGYEPTCGQRPVTGDRADDSGPSRSSAHRRASQ